MKPNKKYYTEIISEELEPYYDEKKHGSIENFTNIISKSIDETIKFYSENFDFDDEEFDTEVFESDLITDAKKSVNSYKKNKRAR